MSNKLNNSDFSYEEEILVKKKVSFKEPRNYAVILYNDDYTTQEFVTHILIKFFHKSLHEAYDLMMKVHLEGKAKVAACCKDIADTKVSLVTSYARKSGMPLLVTAECEE